MSNTKHTPGPWTYAIGQGLYEQRYVIDSTPGRALAVCAGFEPRNEANARLIAAAPELLEALEAFKAIDAFDGWHPKYRDAIAKAEAAIAKATAQ